MFKCFLKAQQCSFDRVILHFLHQNHVATSESSSSDVQINSFCTEWVYHSCWVHPPVAIVTHSPLRCSSHYTLQAEFNQMFTCQNMHANNQSTQDEPSVLTTINNKTSVVVLNVVWCISLWRHTLCQLNYMSETTLYSNMLVFFKNLNMPLKTGLLHVHTQMIKHIWNKCAWSSGCAHVAWCTVIVMSKNHHKFLTLLAVY